MTRRHANRTARRKAERGFTLIELMLTLVLLAVGVLSLASSSALLMREMGEGSSMSRAATAAQSRFESLRGLSCSSGSFASGSASSRGIDETWTVSAPAELNASVTVKKLIDSVTYTTPRGKKAQVYTSYQPC